MIDVIVMAAGKSSRFGSDKLIAEVDYRPLLAVTLDMVLETMEPDRVMVVVGPNDQERTSIAQSRFVRKTVALDAARGIRWSIQSGLDAASADASGVAIVLGDDPIAAGALPDVLNTATGIPDRIVAVRRLGSAPHPVYLPRVRWPTPPHVDDDSGLRSLLDSDVEWLDLPGAAESHDVDDSVDLAALRVRLVD